MIEGKADVSGSTVKIDTSDEIKNLYKLAKMASDENNVKDAAKYYEMLLAKDPNSWEASFYSVYFKAMSCNIAQIRSAAASVKNRLHNTLTLIRDHSDGETAQKNAVLEIVNKNIDLCSMLALPAKKIL